MPLIPDDPTPKKAKATPAKDEAPQDPTVEQLADQAGTTPFMFAAARAYYHWITSADETVPGDQRTRMKREDYDAALDTVSKLRVG